MFIFRKIFFTFSLTSVLRFTLLPYYRRLVTCIDLANNEKAVMKTTWHNPLEHCTYWSALWDKIRFWTGRRIFNQLWGCSKQSHTLTPVNVPIRQSALNKFRHVWWSLKMPNQYRWSHFISFTVAFSIKKGLSIPARVIIVQRTMQLDWLNS